MKNYFKIQKKKKGFTLIELIIVLAIIAVISAIAIPKFGNIQKSARIKADIANAKNIATAVSAGISDGTITSTNSPINLAITTGNGSNLISSYLQSIPTPQLTGYDHFYVTIDNNGNVTVYASTSATANATANGVKVYPTQDSAYNVQ